MRSTRLALAALASGAVLAAVLATPAAAAPAVTGPNSSECINAKAVLSNAQTAQAAAQAAYNQAVKNRDDALDIYNAALADGDATNDAPALAKLNNAKDALLSANLILDERIKAVSAAQDKVDAACATVTPLPTPTPSPLPVFQSCAVAFAAGVHDIPRTDPRYRLFLDRDRDGVACEQNGDDTRPPTVTVPPPANSTTVINPPANITVVNPPPVSSGGSFTTTQVPSGAVATGDGSLARQ